MAEYPTVVEVLRIHALLARDFGEFLEAAVIRPQTGYYDDPVAEPAALLEGTRQMVATQRRGTVVEMFQ